ncbi:MAG: ROK family protein [Candidatus Omnitrophica bacterium]|nr:ROK family protein [Candidatus Omnitrophota bacterium]MDD5429220.1 ROK family protein [Candidatus Omnitrophota bacterium]
MADKKYSIGVGLNLFDAQAVLFDQKEGVVSQIKKKRSNVSANETIEVLLELLEKILVKAKKHRNDIEGVGIALGGIVSRSKGVVHWPDKEGSYVSVPLGDYLQKRFKLPVVIVNDANACAWAEYFAYKKKYNNMVYMFSGVGCGIIAGGRLYEGKDASAGELFLNSRSEMHSHFGDFSFLRQWPADLDTTKKAKELISLGKETSLLKRISSSGELPLDSIFSEVQKKDKIACAVIKEAALSLGVKAAFLINLLNPDALIIGGGFEKAGDVFLNECTRIIKSFSFNEIREGCKVLFSLLKEDASSQGAARLVFEENALQR